MVSHRPNGTLEFKFVVRCPFHRDVGDASGTFCSKAMVYDGDNIALKNVARQQLQQWCLEGRKQYRANTADKSASHKVVNPKMIGMQPLQPLQDQDKYLAEGMAASRWVIHDADDDADGTDEDDDPH